MMSAKLSTPDLKLKIFWSKDNDVIISVHDITNKILLRHSNLYCRWGHVTKVRNWFFERWFWFKLNNLGLVIAIALEFDSTVAKG